VSWAEGKNQRQALDRTTPRWSLRPGQIERRAQDKVRDGASDLYAALASNAGMGLGQAERQRRFEEFRDFLYPIERNLPARLDVHMILEKFGSTRPL
jgi:hypothetical protein